MAHGDRRPGVSWRGAVRAAAVALAGAAAALHLTSRSVLADLAGIAAGRTGR